MNEVDLSTADGQDRYVPSATRDITSAGHEGVYEWIVEHLVSDGMKALDEEIKNPLVRIKSYFEFWEGCIKDRTLSFYIGALLAAEMPSLPEEIQAEIRLHFSTPATTPLPTQVGDHPNRF